MKNIIYEHPSDDPEYHKKYMQDALRRQAQKEIELTKKIAWVKSKNANRPTNK